MNGWTLQPAGYWPLLLLVTPVSLWWGWWLARRHARATAALFGPREREVLGEPGPLRLRMWLAVLASFACLLALLRPVAPGREAALRPDLVLCVDVSRSMAAADAAPDRFAQLQAQVHELLDGAVGSRFALVAFAGAAEVVSPLTADRRAIGWLVDELLPGAIALEGGTDLGAAIAAAVQALERVDARGDIVLLTDGEDFGGAGRSAAAAAAAAGHRVHCVGYGSREGSKIVVDSSDGQRFLEDARGVDVVTRLDEASLRGIAAAGDGAFVLARATPSLLPLWREDLVPHAAQQRLAAGAAGGIERFAWPLLLGVLLWMLRSCLPERRR